MSIESKPLEPLPEDSQVELPPDTLGSRVKRWLLGPPLDTEKLAEERLGKPTALAVFASDNLSSAAYATEEILLVLIPVIGVAAFARVLPISMAMLVVLGFLILSYRQTIKAYPSAGGAYMVTRQNFGLLAAQVAGVALLVDYVLTVAGLGGRRPGGRHIGDLPAAALLDTPGPRIHRRRRLREPPGRPPVREDLRRPDLLLPGDHGPHAALGLRPGHLRRAPRRVVGQAGHGGEGPSRWRAVPSAPRCT